MPDRVEEMKPGEYWKIGPTIWAKVTNVSDSEVQFEVINGLWEGRINRDRQRVYVDKKDTNFPISTVAGPLTRKQVTEQCGY